MVTELRYRAADQLCPRVTINKLPDELLLQIFEDYLPECSYFDENRDAWHRLVHVCRQWRYVVFGSPRRLDLRLLYANGRLLKPLDIWPDLPIIIRVYDEKLYQPPNVANVISVLKQHNRVCKIGVYHLSKSFLKELAVTSESFPVLIELELATLTRDLPILPDSFLGGSVPHLRSLKLDGVPFPGIGKLLLSTRDLVFLSLEFIPSSGFISPEAMVDILSALTKLESLHLNFEIPPFWTHEASQLPHTRVILPALTHFDYEGDTEYLEDMVSRIDAPLTKISVGFIDELTFDIPLLRDFFDRTQILDAPDRAYAAFSSFDAEISFSQRKDNYFKILDLKMPFYPPDSQLSSLAQALSWLLPSLSSLEFLGIVYRDWSSDWQHEVENAEWMELLRPFIGVKDLALDKQFVSSVASALQDLVGEQVTEILPALQNIILKDSQSSGPVPEGIGEFIAARELSGRLVVVHHGTRSSSGSNYFAGPVIGRCSSD
jgi:hypothetical protein